MKIEMKNVASSIKLAKSMEYIFFQDIINIDDDVIEVIVVISSIIKWIANTKKKKKQQQHGNKHFFGSCNFQYFEN